MTTYRILSLDGGGIRGIITGILIRRLEERVPGWLDQVDLIAGTSTGGLLALAIAHGLEVQEIIDLYEQRGRDIFDDSWLDDLLDVGRLTGAEYGNKKLTREVKRIFGDATLGDLGRRVLVTAFDLDNEAEKPAKRCWKPKIFHNFPGRDSDRAVAVHKAALYTTAAPTYFPVVDGYVDGGVYANNPSMCALAQSQDKRCVSCPPALEHVRLLSFGTGRSLKYIRGKRLDWGYAQWARPLVEIMMDGVAGIADYQCGKMLGARYHRLAPTFPPGTSMPLDAVDRLPEMTAFARSVRLRTTARWLEREWT